MEAAVAEHRADVEQNKDNHSDENCTVDGSKNPLADVDTAEDNLTRKNRYWYSSTCFPLLAAASGPLANVFSLCALVSNWRDDLTSGVTEDAATSIQDPKWLVVLNAVSLALGFLANNFLLLNFAHRVRYKIAQPLTIVLWYICLIILVTMLAVTSSDLRISPWSQYAFSQSFYYAIFAAILYAVSATLLSINLVGTFLEHYMAEFDFTISQRTLMVQTISLMIWMAGGAGVFARVEGWSYNDAIYYCDVSILTVGLGDFKPATHLGRALFIPYTTVGILMLGLVVGSIHTMVMERAKRKIGRRLLEKQRHMKVKAVDDHGDDVLLGDNEESRKKREFDTMRMVQQKSETRKKYISLAASASVFLGFWLIGSMVFMFTEAPQGWTYFEGVYFTWTCLTTIGYGDLYPQSNSGKPFFVLWSILAVPAMTILISDMGDTVLVSVKSASVWLGELAVLPSQSRGPLDVLERGLARTGLKGKDAKLNEMVRHKQNLKEGQGIVSSQENAKQKKKAEKDTEIDEMGAALEEEEQQEQAQHDDDSEDIKDDRHLNFLLAKELQKMLKDISSDPPKKYTFEEWSWYMKLLHAETSGSKTIPSDPSAPEDEEKGDDAPNLDIHEKDVGAGSQKGSTDEQQASSGVPNTSPNDHKNPPELGKGIKKGNPDNEWSWLDRENPLMAKEEETDWVIHRLCAKLMEGLQNESRLRKEKNKVA